MTVFFCDAHRDLITQTNMECAVVFCESTVLFCLQCTHFMCEQCIERSIEVTGQSKVRCPLCKTVNDSNPMDFEPISEDMLKVHEPKLRRKGEIVDQDTGETFLEMWTRVFRRRVERVSAPTPAVEAVTIVQPDIIDLTVADVVDLTNM